MSKIMENLVVLIEPTEHRGEIPLKAGRMILNRFCIDEDAAFELSEVNYLKSELETWLIDQRKAKGKEFKSYKFYS